MVWVVSMAIQQLFVTNNVSYGLFLFAKSCEVTGYPIARCIPDYDKLQIFTNYALNILFWFWVIHLFWSFFKSRSQVS